MSSESCNRPAISEHIADSPERRATSSSVVAVKPEDREAAAQVFDARARRAGHPATVTMERHHAKVIRAGEGDGYDAVQAAAVARLAERERCAKHLETRADRVDPPGGKRVPIVDQHTASVLRSNAKAIRESAHVQ